MTRTRSLVLACVVVVGGSAGLAGASSRGFPGCCDPTEPQAARPDPKIQDAWNQYFATVTKRDASFLKPAPAAGTAPASAITWHFDVFEAYDEALRRGRPLVAVFRFPGCEFCNKADTELLFTPKIAPYMSRAVFAYVDTGSTDPLGNVAKLVTSLAIEKYPTAEVLVCRRQEIAEIGRIIGYVEETEFRRQLEKLLGAADRELATPGKRP